MYTKIFKGMSLLILSVIIFSCSACTGRNASLGQISWGHLGESDKIMGTYNNDWSIKDNIFRVGKDDIEEFVLDAHLKAETRGSVYIEIINNSRANKVEWKDTVDGGNVKFSITLSDLKADDLYSINIEAHDFKTFNFGITPTGNIKFADKNGSDVYIAVKR